MRARRFSCDAATGRCRAEVPHSVSPQCRPRLFCGADEAVQARRSDEIGQALRGNSRNLDVTRFGHFPILAQNVDGGAQWRAVPSPCHGRPLLHAQWPRLPLPLHRNTSGRDPGSTSLEFGGAAPVHVILARGRLPSHGHRPSVNRQLGTSVVPIPVDVGRSGGTANQPDVSAQLLHEFGVWEISHDRVTDEHSPGWPVTDFTLGHDGRLNRLGVGEGVVHDGHGRT